MTKDYSMLKKVLLIVTLITVAVGWRVINHNYNFAPNLELVTTVSVLAAIMIGMRAAFIVPVGTMIVSDIIIGNTSIFIFTWSAFALIGLAANLMRKLNDQPKKQILYSVGFAAASSFAFFVITNFGVWAQGWYPVTLAGLTDCFVLAIPFYRTMLIGNLILVPTAVAAYQFVKARQTAKGLIVDTLVRD
jgi:hypothetical protein